MDRPSYSSNNNNNVQKLRHFLTLLLSLVLTSGVETQVIVIPKTQVEEPFKNNGKWEDFKTAQLDRVKILGTLAANVWTWLDNLEESNTEQLEQLFMHFHVVPFIEFFKLSESRLVHGNPYAILDPAIGIHTMESLYRLSNLPNNPLLDKFKVKWTEVDSMALSIHMLFNETMRKIISGGSNLGEEILKGKKAPSSIWISHLSGEPENGTIKDLNVDELSDQIDKDVDSLGPANHLMRGLVKLLTSMAQKNVDTREELNYYCYGNNDFGILQDIYDVITDAALYLCMADMKKLVLDVVFMAYSTFLKDDGIPHNEEARKKAFHNMEEKIKRKIDFDYLEGSDYTELPHSAIFKCDLPPTDPKGIPTQWGRNVTSGISPAASATNPFDPQAGPEKEDGNVGYLDERTPTFDYAQFDKSYHGYLEAEIVLNPEGLCQGTCRDYRRPTPTCPPEKGIDCKEYRDSHCDPLDTNCMDSNQCPEFARDCQRAASTVRMCTSEREDRHYSHFHLTPDPDKILGTSSLNNNDTEGPSGCKGETRVARERWEMEYGVILRNPQYCELCVCTCMTPQDPKNQHYVDLRPQEADVENGYIVSAVRFFQEDKVLRLAIEQGKPLEAGEIDPKTTNWLDSAPADKLDPEQAVPLGQKGFLRWNFDIVTGEAHQVVTGVRLSVDESRSVYLQVQVAPITWPDRSPSEITLKSSEKIWMDSQQEQDPSNSQPRLPLTFTRPTTPLLQRGPSMPDVVYNSYVEFTTTDYDLDLAQSTIPFFDAQPVHHFETKRWLQGVGMMHKGKPGSGGYISPMIVPSKGRISADFARRRRRASGASSRTAL